jgi:hypothetical protein
MNRPPFPSWPRRQCLVQSGRLVVLSGQAGGLPVWTGCSPAGADPAVKGIDLTGADGAADGRNLLAGA